MCHPEGVDGACDPISYIRGYISEQQVLTTPSASVIKVGVVLRSKCLNKGLAVVIRNNFAFKRHCTTIKQLYR